MSIFHRTLVKIKACVCSVYTGNVVYKEQLKHGKKLKASSQNWLLRQINDRYVKQAKTEHYRCRSAFKLLELDKKYGLLRPGQVVVDLGCAPGSWTQVVVRATGADKKGSKSLVIGIDKSPVHPIEGAKLLSGLDFTTNSAQDLLSKTLQSRGVDVVLSDMAPSTSGVKSLDHTNIISLCYSALRFAERVSNEGGTLVMKVFDGGETTNLIKDAKLLYEAVRIVRPDASRKDSTEMFLVCLKFKKNEVYKSENDNRISK